MPPSDIITIMNRFVRGDNNIGIVEFLQALSHKAPAYRLTSLDNGHTWSIRLTPTVIVLEAMSSMIHDMDMPEHMLRGVKERTCVLIDKLMELSKQENGYKVDTMVSCYEALQDQWFHQMITVSVPVCDHKNFKIAGQDNHHGESDIEQED